MKTLNFSPSTTLTINDDGSIVYETAEKAISISPKNGDNPLTLPDLDNQFARELGYIVDRIANRLKDIATDSSLVENLNPLNFIRQIEPGKFIVEDQISRFLLGIQVDMDTVESTNLGKVIFTYPETEPVIYSNVALNSLSQIWKKSEPDYESYLTKVVHPDLESLDSDTYNRTDVVTGLMKNFGDDIYGAIDTLGGFVLKEEDLVTLRSEVDILQGETPNIVLKQFLAYTSPVGDDVVSFIFHQKGDRTGTSYEFTHGDSSQPAGELGWAITENFGTGTKIEKTVRYI